MNRQQLTGGECFIVFVLVCGCWMSGAERVNKSTGERLTPRRLICEYLVNPVGIDRERPRLSWQVVSNERGQRQTAYQLLVAGTAEKLDRDMGDLWDTGKVNSDRTTHIAYDGKSLPSFQYCYWKVRVWDRDGQVSDWSEPATWSMGILHRRQWGGQWIGYVPPARRVQAQHPHLAFHDCQWIWYPQGDPQWGASAGEHYFRRVFHIPADDKVTWAGLIFTVDDQFKLYINGKKAAASDGKANAWSRTQQAEVTSLLVGGRNVLAVTANNTSGSAGVTGKLVMVFADGKQMTIKTDDLWRVSREKTEGWMRREFDDSGWKTARILGSVNIGPWGMLLTQEEEALRNRVPAPLLRKEFETKKALKRATIYICGLGYYELRLNGAKVGDHVLDPAFTQYNKRCLYVGYDVTDQILKGKNAVGVILGNGWLNVHTRAAWDFYQAPWRARPMLLLQLRLEYTDGTAEAVVSDAGWRATTGPIVQDEIREGEHYDARLEKPGWDRPGYDGTDWDAAQVIAGPKGSPTAQMFPAIKVTETLKPVKLTEPKPGVFIFDLGQNIPGWAQLQVKGPAGTKVQLRYGERLKPDGTLEQKQIAAHTREKNFQLDTYTLKGGATEIWEPRFVYHGFQYVEVTGYPGRPTLESLRGRVVHTAFESAGSFACSNEFLNTIQRLTRWSYRGNYHGYPTDCPHREKNGWTGDAHLATEQAQYNFQNSAAYTKWMNDFQDEMRQTGELPGIVPTSGWGYKWGNGPAWDSAYILIPWYLYQYQGDRDILRRHYPHMKRYVDYLTRRSNEQIISIGLGDWVPAKTKTPEAVTSTGYYYIDTLVVSRVAELLGKKDEAARYSQLAEDIRKAFHRTFYKGNGIYANGSQTALSCALFQGLAAEEEKDKVVEQLVSAVAKTDYHIDTGILGAKYLFNALAENGRIETAYRLATQRTYPGYGDWIRRGATTLWEDWPGGASLNHIMFGDISAWFYKYLAGIRIDPRAPGFRHILIRPRPVGDLRWVKAEHESLHGTIRCHWRIENERIFLDVTVPANTTATVYVPSTDRKSVRESVRPAETSPAVRFLGQEENAVVYEVGSGTYAFVGPYQGKK